MEPILIARETLINLYKRYEIFINPILKFLLGLYLFQKIHSIGYAGSPFAMVTGPLSSFPAAILLSAAFVLLPYSLSYLIMIIDITLQYSANIEIAAVVFLSLICILLFYARMAAKESILIIATYLAFHFKVPYITPLIVGMYFSLTAIIPVTIGVFLYEYTPVIQGLVTTTKSAGLNITEIPSSLTEVYTSLSASLTTSSGWLFTAFIFAMVIVIVHVVSRLSIDFAKEIAIVLGCILNIFGHVMAVLIARETVSIPGVIFFSLLCAALAELVRFFDTLLDYQRAEAVQFEDENNYYYVRVVPKVLLTKRKRVVRRIRPQPEDEE